MSNFEVYSMVLRKIDTDRVDRATLESMSNFIMDDIERLFGPKMQIPLTEIYFSSSHGQYETHLDRGLEVSKIRLSSGSTKQPGWALAQLAHECVHMLHPTNRNSSVLEEGLATWYQMQWVAKSPQLFPDWHRSPYCVRDGWWCSYDDAVQLVKRLIGPDLTVIRRMREKQPALSEITAAQILKNAPWLSPESAKALARRFKKTRSLRRNLPPTVI